MGDHHIHSKTCGCDHSNPNADSQSLYKYINVESISCLNESIPNSGKKVFKPHEDRLTNNSIVESDDDHELIFTIPFTGNVKVTGIIISGTDAMRHPKKVSLFKDRPTITFDSIENADQELDLTIDRDGDIVYDLKPTRFSSLSHLSLYISANHGDSETTQIDYIGLRGKFMTPFRKEATVSTVYELRPTPQDQKVKDMTSANHFIQ